MNWLDIIIAIILVINLFVGLKTGLIKMAIPFVGLVLGIFLAGRFYQASNVSLGFRIYPDKEGMTDGKLILKPDTKKPYDQTIESHGVNIFLAPKYSGQLKYMELDYVEGPTGGFVLKNQC
jgi:hypothetical protein